MIGNQNTFETFESYYHNTSPFYYTYKMFTKNKNTHTQIKIINLILKFEILNFPFLFQHT